jgi:hypothetical protein
MDELKPSWLVRQDSLPAENTADCTRRHDVAGELGMSNFQEMDVWRGLWRRRAYEGEAAFAAAIGFGRPIPDVKALESLMSMTLPTSKKHPALGSWRPDTRNSRALKILKGGREEERNAHKHTIYISLYRVPTIVQDCKGALNCSP